jgi:hypothetical protein
MVKNNINPSGKKTAIRGKTFSQAAFPCLWAESAYLKNGPGRRPPPGLQPQKVISPGASGFFDRKQETANSL